MNADFREATLNVNLDAESKGYQQALVDFCVVDLIAQIGVCSEARRMELEPEEREALAAIFVKRLCDTLTETHVSQYFNFLQYGAEDLLPNPIPIEVLPSSHLTLNFSDAVTPRYSEGTRVRWKSTTENREWGVVIGRFYAFAPHHGGWTWRYVVWLDFDSPSAEWITSDTAWEDDLVPLEDAA